MKFLMNNREWEIKELSQDEMRETFTKYDQKQESGRYFGLTWADTGMIYLDKDLCLGQKIQTLKHELMHCYIYCHLFDGDKSYTEEDLCNISANAHDSIHEIVVKYFKGAKK